MRSRSTAGAGLALACLLAITACGGGGSSDDSGGESAAVEATTEAATANEIPDLVGEDQSSAEEQLTELGVRFDSKIESSSQEAGTVIAQNPEEGTPVEGDGPQVTLTVAGDPPAVPNVMGSPVDDARRDLEKLGFTVEETDVFAPDAPNGEVVGQDPDAGDSNAATVTLEVARPPQSMPFKDTKPITSGGGSGPQVDSARSGTRSTQKLGYSSRTAGRLLSSASISPGITARWKANSASIPQTVTPRARQPSRSPMNRVAHSAMGPTTSRSPTPLM